jgi:uncharacterized protein
MNGKCLIPFVVSFSSHLCPRGYERKRFVQRCSKQTSLQMTGLCVLFMHSYLAMAVEPAFNCKKVPEGSIEALVCHDAELAALDLKLATVFKQASKKASNEHPPVLKAEQRGWIKGRNDCWKSPDNRQCVKDAYLQRISELQARYQLIAGTGPIVFVCNANPADQVTVTFFPSDLPTLIVERGDSVSLMYQQPSASGTRYQGRNEIFWEHQGEATITWGFEAPELHCRYIR